MSSNLIGHPIICGYGLKAMIEACQVFDTGSIPVIHSLCPCGLTVMISVFQTEDTGSIPVTGFVCTEKYGFGDISSQTVLTYRQKRCLCRYGTVMYRKAVDDKTATRKGKNKQRLSYRFLKRRPSSVTDSLFCILS